MTVQPNIQHKNKPDQLYRASQGACLSESPDIIMAAPRVVAAAAVAASSAGSSGGSSGAGLGAAGKAFFGSLCVGTFGLGCWQTSRLLEKQQLMAQRTEELQQTATNQITPGTFRRIQVQGVYDHTRELLVGPRSGPSTAGSTQKGGGTTVAGVSQQGYYVVTPHRRA